MPAHIHPSHPSAIVAQLFKLVFILLYDSRKSKGGCVYKESTNQRASQFPWGRQLILSAFLCVCFFFFPCYVVCGHLVLCSWNKLRGETRGQMIWINIWSWSLLATFTLFFAFTAHEIAVRLDHFAWTGGPVCTAGASLTKDDFKQLQPTRPDTIAVSSPGISTPVALCCVFPHFDSSIADSR